jgi:hypothetical protein
MAMRKKTDYGGYNPVVLDLCGGTGAWSRPYLEAGYTVDMITMPQYDVMWVDFGTNAMSFKRRGVHYHETRTVLYQDLCGILAAPPCKEFSIAKGARPRDLGKGMETVEACMRIIWEVRKHTNLQFWALENPRGLLRQFLGIPRYTFEQWQFGGNKRKHTDVWGYFNPPTPTVREFPADLVKNGGRSRAHAADCTRCIYPPEYEAYIRQFHGDDRRAAARAITPEGFAKAFYRANKPKGGDGQ